MKPPPRSQFNDLAAWQARAPAAAPPDGGTGLLRTGTLASNRYNAPPLINSTGEIVLELEAVGLACIRDDRTLFEDLSFRLDAGQVLLLEGRNGSGKTSLLRILCGIRLPDAGKLTWKGQDIFSLGPDYHASTPGQRERDF